MDSDSGERLLSLAVDILLTNEVAASGVAQSGGVIRKCHLVC
jgi:hypothetical protein